MRVWRFGRGWGLVIGMFCGACSGVIEEPSPGSVAVPAADGGVARPVDRNDRDAAVSTKGAAPTLSRRLSRVELDHSLADLFGDATAPATRLLPEDLYSPYDNDVASQLASSAYVDSLSALAADVAQRAVTDAAAHAKLLPCQPQSPSDEACFRRVVSALLPRVLRRPVKDTEVAAYLPLLELANAPEQTALAGFDMALQLLIEALVLDPEFIYRVEAAGPRALSDYEIAVRLSFLLWGTTPDKGLYADAQAGHLVPLVERKRVFQRMWQDERAHQQLQRFHAQWLGYRAISQSPQLAAAFAAETNALIDRVVWADDSTHSYLELFSSPATYLDKTLAEHYGLPAPALPDPQAQDWVDYPKDSGRAGILSHGSVLAAFGKFSDTSPTQRGIFVRTRLMCQPIPPPPPTVAADKPPAGSKDAVCKIDRYAQHRADAACASCHALTDAIGFGLENYDLAGRYRSHDDGLDQCGIEGRGEISGVGAFHGPRELAALLLDNDLLAPCVVQQVLQFALGHTPDAALLARLRAEFQAHDHSLEQLIEAFVLSEAFGQQAEEP